MLWIHANRAIIGDGYTVLSPAWVAVEGDKIQAVTSTKPGAATAENTLELGDVTLTPGLMNIHDHISRKALREPSEVPFSQRSRALMSEDPNYLILHSARNARNALLREGITWLRDYGLAGYTTIQLKRAIAEGLVEGPELSACGRPICQTGGHTYRQAHEADGPDAVRAAVRAEIRAGADVIKFMASGGLEHFPKEDPRHVEYTEEEMRAGVEAAHDHGIYTAAHAYPTAAILRAVRAGVDSIEHGALMTEECIELMVKKGTSLVPTMTGIRGPWARYRSELQDRIYGPQENGMRMALKAGIPIGAGTDSAGKLSDEIREIARALGETPVQALAHATSINARIARRPDLGLLAEGKRADIVAFKGDLTQSLDRLDEVVQVWKAGKAYL